MVYSAYIYGECVLNQDVALDEVLPEVLDLLNVIMGGKVIR